MKKLFTILLIIILIPVYSYAGVITLDGILSKEDYFYANNINDGFDRRQNNDYYEFVSDVSDIDIVSKRHGVTAVSKAFNHDTLLIGHSIVAFSFDYLKTLPIDVVGLAGGHYSFGYKISKLINKKYKKIYVWLGINDILKYRDTDNPPYEWYANTIKDIDKYKNIYDTNYTDIVFFTISHTNEPIVNDIIDMVNYHLEVNYKTIKVDKLPDLDEYHFKESTVKQIVDTCFKK